VWDDLKFKLFVVNNNGNKLPSLWGLCKSGLNPIVMANSDQHIAMSVDLYGRSMFIAAFYANTKNKFRRALWSELYAVIHTNPDLWCCLGDFNGVLGAHECRSYRILGRLACAELLHWPNIGAQITWSNKRTGVASTERGWID
ncbi:hypothetical protein Lal_00031231, partial [Lupinus albus]